MHNLKYATYGDSAQLCGHFRSDPEGIMRVIAYISASEFLPPASRRILIDAALNGGDIRQKVPLRSIN
jgi:hypothetical protein